VPLKYANSGDVTGDKSSVVGYLAAALVAAGEDTRAGKAGKAAEAGPAGQTAEVGVDLGLDRDEKLQLLKIARQSMEAAVRGKAKPEFKVTSVRLKENWGAFVTLTEGGELRGCIGHIVGTEALHKCVAEMAVAAATQDPRFSPVTEAELAAIELEISVLTPLRRISDPAEIQVGRDGIYIEKGYYRGLLLPQVATDYGWDRYEFLDNTCLKAGLPRGAWKEGATIQIFSGQIFNEAEMSPRDERR
jgi:AmmeMemoRadiSam system protein A